MVRRSRIALLVVLALGVLGCAGDSFVDTEPGAQFRYGEGRKQFGVVSRPAGSDPLPVVVLIHGGFWRDGFGLDLMAPLATDLVDRGFAVWNLEYRGVGGAGGGVPETLDDIAAGIEYLAELQDQYGLDLDRVAFVGHSAGGHLALWAAGEELSVEPAIAIGQAAVVDLYRGAETNLGRGAVQAFVGGEPDQVGDAYALAQPRLDERTVLVHGDADDIVPVEQSTAVADEVEVVVIEGEAHFAHLEVGSASWTAVLDALAEL